MPPSRQQASRRQRIAQPRRRSSNVHSFGRLVCRVGTALAFLGNVVYLLITEHRALMATFSPVLWTPTEVPFVAPTDTAENSKFQPPPDPLVWDYDAFGLHARATNSTTTTKIWSSDTAVEDLLRQFASLYGGAEAARKLMHTSLVYPNAPVAEVLSLWAPMFVADRRLELVVVGDAAPAGYGNSHTQAYSYEWDNRLFDLRHVHVQNLAALGWTAFPAAWCLPSQVDVMVWDFATPSLEVLEALLRLHRHSTSRWIFRARDWTRQHYELLQHYASFAPWKSCVVIPSHARAPVPDRWGDASGEREADWISLPQHSWIGWMLTLQMVAVGEYAQQRLQDVNLIALEDAATDALPRPMHLLDEHLFEAVSTDSIHCYSSREFATRNAAMEVDPMKDFVEANLKDVVVNGTVVTQPDEWLLPKKVQWWLKGWVLDVDPSSQQRLRRTQNSDFRNFRDWNLAYYGTVHSGALQLRLPLASNSGTSVPEVGMVSLILCAESPPTPMDTCRLDEDIQLHIDGQEAFMEAISISPQCVNVILPETVASSNEVTVSIQVHASEAHTRNRPCSIAQVIWQSVHPTQTRLIADSTHS